MKTFSTLITEANLTIPTFKHKDLNKPRDPEGKFWKAVEAANDESEKASRGTYEKTLKLAKDLYTALTNMPEDEDIVDARHCASEAVKFIEKSSKGTVDEVGVADLKFLRNCVHIIKTADDLLSHKRYYKDATVDVKAGYVPFKGAAKDPKIKYRMVVRANAPIKDQATINKTLIDATPITKDYIAGVEWNGDKSAFAILITNSPGYKR